MTTTAAEVPGPADVVRDRRMRAPNRETILNVAAELFGRRGYRSTTMQDLAHELGISKATLYAHANSKADVLVGVIELWTRHLDEDLDHAVKHPNTVERVRLLLRSWTERSVSMRAHRRVFDLCATDHELPADVSVRYRDWEHSLEDRLRTLVELAQQLHVVRAEVDPTVAAVALINAPYWAADRLVQPGLMDVDAAVDQILDVLLFGLFRQDGPTEVGPVEVGPVETGTQRDSVVDARG